MTDTTKTTKTTKTEERNQYLRLLMPIGLLVGGFYLQSYMNTETSEPPAATEQVEEEITATE